MPTYRKVPAKIITQDWVGVTTSESEKYWKRAEAELAKLEGMVLRGDLEQGVRRFDLGDNVEVICRVAYNINQATVVIGAHADTSLHEQECYCCSPCLVAGRIVSVEAPYDEETEEYVYDVDADYYADVMVCQNPDMEIPRRVTVIEERASGGVKSMVERVLHSYSYGGELVLNAIYSDYKNHKPGEAVFVLVQPLYSFTPYPGEYSPCINRRRVADGIVESPLPAITNAFINSSGLSCQIMKDAQVWDPAIEPYTGDIKYNPFRILPIRIDGCL